MTTPMASNERPSARGAGHSTGLRIGLALLATGGFLLLAGAVFLLPFALSPYPIQNDVYMSNLFLSPAMLLLGVILTIVGFVTVILGRGSRGAMPWVLGRAVTLAVAGGVVIAAANFLFGGQYVSYGPGSVYWPPYLTLPLLALTGVLAIAVFLAALVWGGRAAVAPLRTGGDLQDGSGAAPV